MGVWSANPHLIALRQRLRGRPDYPENRKLVRRLGPRRFPFLIRYTGVAHANESTSADTGLIAGRWSAILPESLFLKTLNRTLRMIRADSARRGGHLPFDNGQI